jgi:outer membrane protein OmpA-like peptidoglycan-associated protein
MISSFSGGPRVRHIDESTHCLKRLYMKSTILVAFASLALLSACAGQPPADSPTEADKPAAAAGISPLGQLKKQLAALESMGLKLEESADALRVTMQGAAVFASASSVVQPSAQEALDRIAAAMAAVPQSKLTVVGHTDSGGASRYNQSLSESRAKAVLDYIAGKGVDAARMMAEGRGELEPVADNATAKGRAANRRVELLLNVQ